MNCLYSEKPYLLREMLRKGCADDDIAMLFRSAFDEKHIDGFEAKKASSETKVGVDQIGRSSMTQIGG